MIINDRLIGSSSKKISPPPPLKKTKKVKVFTKVGRNCKMKEVMEIGK